MFSRLIVGNFKAIRDTVEIDLRPITLLFGPNAAGKSSVLHAVHYLAELLRGGPRDVHQTTLSGGLLDLGGFDNVVHGRDPMGRVTLGIEYDRPASPDFDEDVGNYLESDLWLAESPAAYGLRQQVRAYRLLVTVGRFNGRPLVLAVETEINHEPLAAIRLDGSDFVGQPQRLLRLNTRHPLLEGPREQATGQESQSKAQWLGGPLSGAEGQPAVDANGILELPIHFVEPGSDDDHPGDALPRPRSEVHLSSPATERLVKGLFPTLFPDNSVDLKRALSDAEAKADDARTALGPLLTVLLSEPVTHAWQQSHRMVHVGPLRTIPRRDGDYIGNPESDASWYDGGGAWQHLGAFKKEAEGGQFAFFARQLLHGLVDQVNAFLHNNRLLSTGLRLQFVRERRFRDNREEIARAEGENEYESDPDALVPVPPAEPFPALFGMDQYALRSMSKDELVALIKQIQTASAGLPHRDWLILRDDDRGMDLTLQDVAVGVAQVIPVLVAMLGIDTRGLRVVEQPELHLHPKAQVALGDALILGAAQRRWGEAAVYETHSEHLMLRLLRRVRNTTEAAIANAQRAEDEEPIEVAFPLKPEHLAVIYVEPSPNGARVRRLRVDEAGEFVDRWPDGFFDERAGEMFA